MYQVLTCNIAALLIASIYYMWRDVYVFRAKRERIQDRVAYMLWVAANRTA